MAAEPSVDLGPLLDELDAVVGQLAEAELTRQRLLDARGDVLLRIRETPGSPPYSVLAERVGVSVPSTIASVKGAEQRRAAAG